MDIPNYMIPLLASIGLGHRENMKRHLVKTLQHSNSLSFNTVGSFGGLGRFFLGDHSIWLFPQFLPFALAAF